MFTLLFRYAFVYFFMIFSMKTLGKRQVGQMQMSELVTAFFLSELATYTLTDENVTLIRGLLPIVLLIALELAVSFLILKIPFLKHCFDFAPSILIRNGKISRSALMKNRMTLDELMSLLRLNGCTAPEEVNFAILEPNGQLSVVPFDAFEKPNKKDLGLSGEERGYSVAVVDDGRINQKALDCIGRDRAWLEKQMKKSKIRSERDIFVMTADFCGNVKIIQRRE